MSGGGGDATLYEILFELECTLCSQFPALSPFNIRSQSVYEVCLLLKRMNKYSEKRNKEGQSYVPDKNGVIRRPASDDWY